jgi:signal peptidase II
MWKVMVSNVNLLKWLSISLVVIILDQITKSVAVSNLVLFQPVNIFPGFNFTLMYNEGAAFSFLSDASGWQRWFFSTVAIIVSIAIVIWLKTLAPGQRVTALSLTLILGGAIGNVWDRILLGHVVDFIDVYYASYHWPAFNIADSAITVGAAILIIESLLQARHEKNTKPDDSAGSS